MNSEIKFLHNQSIEIERWDQVILGSVNSRVYAFSWFLNILSPDWHGLIVGDYEYVMPIVFSKKWGIQYAYQPVYAQQHGIFPPSTPEISSSIFSFLQKQFRFIDISLNSYNLVNLTNWQVAERKNFILSLRKSYPELAEQYTNGCKSNLKKAVKLNAITSTLQFADFVSFVETTNRLEVVDKTIQYLKQIVSTALDQSAGAIYGAYSENKELTAVAFFLNDGKRYTYLCSFSSETGKKNNSMFSIIDSFIQEHSQQNHLLDFEGSIIPGIAYFFGGFGATPEIYHHVKYNRLPLLMRLFKK
jgi:hypothetical protein